MGRPSAPDEQPPASGPRFCNVAIPHTRLHELTYEFEPERFPDLGPGDCVQVRLRGKRAKGVVLDVLTRSPVSKTLPVEKLVEPRLLPGELMRLLRWVGAYYFGRMGEVLGLALPRGICGHGLRRPKPAAAGLALLTSSVPRPVASDRKGSILIFPPSFSVHAHTRMGAREDGVADFVAAGLERGTVIVLVPEPEIGIWAGRLRSRCGAEPVLYHGDQKVSVRRQVWRALRSAERRLIIGVRSAVFAPVSDLAGVVVLDEHDRVFKEERHPRFNARDAAIARARLADCPVLLCDPIPSAETWLNLRSGQYRVVDSQPASSAPATVSTDELPDTLVVDMRKHRDAVLAPVLVNELREASAAGNSAALYINRRGLSRYVVCRECGSPLNCPSCAVSLVLFSGGDLRCRYCGRTGTAPEMCPTCGSPDFRFRVPGVEMATQEVARLLPDAKVATIVTESVQENDLEPGTLIVGTRALLGVRWPQQVKVVAALSVDADLCVPDFRAGERAFQVLTALSRRAVEHGATLILQTRRPEDAAVQCASIGDVAGFLDGELKLREELGFPPYRRLALIELSARSLSEAQRRGEWLSRRLGQARGVEALGPVPARGRTDVSQVLVKLDRNVRLDRLVTLDQLEAGGVRAKVDVDPLDTV